jgi:hypothetical protein
MDARPNWIHRHRRLTALLGVFTVVVVGAGGWVLAERNRTTPLSLADAMARYRASTTVPASDAAVGAVQGDGAPETPGAPSPEPREEVATPTPAPPSGAPNPGLRAADAGPVVTTPPAVSRYRRPAEGVYSYRASGGESISVAGANHDYPERSYATLRHADGCLWELQLDVIEEHRDELLLCSEPGRVLQLEQGRTVSFFGKQDGVRNRCEPSQLFHAVGETPGTATVVQCGDGKGNHAQMTRTYLGSETMQIDQVEVDVERIRLDGTFSGKAEGTSVDELWLVSSTGMIARWTRYVDTKADAAFGAKVTYRESASFVLESLEPRR